MLSLDGALAAARFVHLLSLMLVAGGLAFPFYALPRSEGAPPPARAPLAAGAAVSLTAALAWFAAAIGGMADDPAAVLDLRVLRDAFAGTQFAPVWAARLLLLAALLALTLLRPGARITALAAAGALASVALTGHARARTGGAGGLHMAADALHLLAAGLWLGALPPLAGLLRRAPADAALAVRRFSAVAAPAVALLLATGALQTWLLAGRPWPPASTAWGRWLLLKLALVAGMVALALWNRLRATPRLPASSGELRRSALAELALGIGAVAAVARLGTLSPTGG